MKRFVGEVEYELTYKRVKQMNLRVRADGSAAVSAPRGVPLDQVDRFVLEHVAWVNKAREKMKTRSMPQEHYTDVECVSLFSPMIDRFYLLVQERAPCKPTLKVRQMKSRWGVCHLGKNYITLNKQLAGKPLAAIEYVVLHELVHLLHPNHQAGFHAEMTRLMPDYKARRALL